MSQIERPIYFEGQVLGSRDLQRSLDYTRDENARHERYLHTWGIAEGLSVEPRGDIFMLQPGFAIDSSGAPIVVPEAVVLDRDQLRVEALLSGDDKGFFPVFVARAEKDKTNGQLIGRCSSAAATRRAETYAIQFRRIATGWDEGPNQSPPPVSDGPDDAPVSDRVVLIGFVKWDNEDRKIVDFTRSHDGILPRYAGVRADEVLGRGGTLTLRSRKTAESDAPMVVVDHHSKEKTFVLGLDDGKGRINEVFSVDAKGNVKAKGDITSDGALNGKIQAGEVSVGSGIAHDGVTLPLPRGISEDDLDSVALHILVNPRIELDSKSTGDHLPIIEECLVDEQRRVKCTIRWFKPGDSAKPETTAGIVDYLVVASVSETKD